MHESSQEWGWTTVPVVYNGKPVHTHVVPNADTRLHQLDPVCWCHPDEEGLDAHGGILYIHNSADKRELYASGALAFN